MHECNDGFTVEGKMKLPIWLVLVENEAMSGQKEFEVVPCLSISCANLENIDDTVTERYRTLANICDNIGFGWK